VRRTLALIAWVAFVPASAAPPAEPTPRFDLERAEIRDFIADVSKRDKIRARNLKTLLGKATPQPKIIELMTKPAEKVSPWWQYRERFMTEERIAQGAQFWQSNREPLERIAAEHSVPPEYIVAIIGVETFYGRITGRYRVLDALSTLAFDYPPRSDFFRKELEEFVVLTRENKIDPLIVTGSYAGAMGASQFMPSSYRRYALDGDADGKRDLWASWPDVFASIANYFQEHGWQPGAPVVLEARLDPDPIFQINPRNLDLNETLASLNTVGVEVDAKLPPDTKAILISAEQRDGPAYRVGFSNFQVITRYNRSVRYAMAVHDLAETVALRVRAAPTTAPPSAPSN
jgi:membrane-bound lytic murein transglycosylase B